MKLGTYAGANGRQIPGVITRDDLWRLLWHGDRLFSQGRRRGRARDREDRHAAQPGGAGRPDLERD